MRVVVCYSTGATRTTVMRSLEDDERRLIISAPWRQSDRVTLAAVADQLSDDEAAEVARAFGVDL